jgi:hypothetical protein
VFRDRGDLHGALVQAEHCVLHRGVSDMGAAVTSAVKVESLVDQGELSAARAVVDADRGTVARVALTVGPGEPVRFFREAEARLLVAEGRYDECLALRDELERLNPFIVNPCMRSWRRSIAAALHGVGRGEEAMALVQEDLATTERWGVEGYVGRDLLLRAHLEGADGEATLRRAADLLEPGHRRLDLARALTALAALVADRDPGEARDLLVPALAQARACSAYALVRRIEQALQRLGTDPAGLPSPPVTLTAIERRVARLAAEGVREEDIALQHFLPTPVVSAMLREVERLTADAQAVPTLSPH